MAIGTKGEIRFDNDFTGVMGVIVIPATGIPLGGGVGIIGIGATGSLTATLDEPGGVCSILTTATDDDNEALVAGNFKPADGGMWMEARFKMPTSVAATREAVWCGFTETFSQTTPVMPSERVGTTNTFNGTGGMLGVMFDGDSTALEFFAVAADGGAALAAKDKNGTAVTTGVQVITGTSGVPGGLILTADRYYIVRVEIAPNGLGRVLFGDQSAALLTNPLQVVFENTTALGTGDSFTAVLMIENRAAADEELEVDYFMGGGSRDWAAN